MLQVLTLLELTPEEEFLWDCARWWRGPSQLAYAESIDWRKVIATARHNRMQTLLQQIFLGTDVAEKLPATERDALWQDAERLRQNAVSMGIALSDYLRLAHQHGVQSVALKGLDLSINIYGNPAMRPGGDIDILVRRGQLRDSIAVLDKMGYGPWWSNLMQDAYYERHHLHLQRCDRAIKIWFEIHWALDHPYTQLTVDYEGMMDRTTEGVLLGQPLRTLSLADQILALVLHLVKHAVYLPTSMNRPDLARIILADGMLMYYVDVAEVIKLHAEAIDWPLAVALARQWGMVDSAGAVLQVCRRLLAAPVPDWVLDALPVAQPGAITRRVLTQMADYELSTYTGAARSRLWDFLVITNGAFILRPIRLLDVASYFLPSADYLRRRYGTATTTSAAGHFLKAAAQYSRVSVDTVYYMWERYRRLKGLQQSASLFNRLETEG